LLQTPHWAVLTQTFIELVSVIKHIEILVAFLRFFLNIGE
jgi:hypothetical protein